jgi:predicted transcriptional regulator YheO
LAKATPFRAQARAEAQTLPSFEALQTYFPLVHGFAALFAPFVEVVLHDLAQDTVACIANPFSPRAVGDPSHLRETEFTENTEVLGPYEKVNYDGRLFKSISVLLRDATRKPVAMMCINADITEFDAMRRVLQSFMNKTEPTGETATLFRDDWHEKINRFVAAWTAEHATTVARLDRSGRRALIEALFIHGGFEGGRAPAYVAAILGLSRATIYNELSRLKNMGEK